MSDRKSLIVEIPFYKSVQALQSFFGGCIKKEGGKAEKGKGGRRETLIDFRRILYRQMSIYIVFDQNSKSRPKRTAHNPSNFSGSETLGVTSHKKQGFSSSRHSHLIQIDDNRLVAAARSGR